MSPCERPGPAHVGHAPRVGGEHVAFRAHPGPTGEDIAAADEVVSARIDTVMSTTAA